MNEATAPTRASPARSAAISAATSKSAVCTRTVIGRSPAAQPPVTGGNSATSSPARMRGFRGGQVVVDRDADRATRGQLVREGAAAGGEPVAQRRRRWKRRRARRRARRPCRTPRADVRGRRSKRWWQCGRRAWSGAWPTGTQRRRACGAGRTPHAHRAGQRGSRGQADILARPAPGAEPGGQKRTWTPNVTWSVSGRPPLNSVLKRPKRPYSSRRPSAEFMS